MNNWENWRRIRRIRGSVYVLTVGILGALAEWTRYGWDRTWPVWIIVVGVLMFAEHSARSAAIASGDMPGVYAPGAYPPGPGPEAPPQGTGMVQQPPQYPPVEPR